MKKILLLHLFFLIIWGNTIKAQYTNYYYFADSEGSINPDGARQPYQRNLYNYYFIMPTGAAHVKLVLYQGEVGRLGNDHLYVYDGPDDCSPLLGVYDIDHPAPDTITSTGYCISIIFETDNIDGQELGWTADYLGVKPIPTKYTDNSGAFGDGIVDRDNCQNFQLKEHLIKSQGISFIQLSFPQLDLDVDITPSLWIYDGDNENSPLIGAYDWNNYPPSLIQSTGNSLLIKYQVDGDCLHFTAQYTCISQKVTFDYDASGNRISRNYIILKSAKVTPAESSSQSTIKEPDKKPYKDKSGNADIIIYPNPTSGNLKVEIANFDFKQKSAIYVYDLQGKMIIQKSPATGSDIIDLSSYTNGLYIMKIELGDKISEWKIMKE